MNEQTNDQKNEQKTAQERTQENEKEQEREQADYIAFLKLKFKELCGCSRANIHTFIKWMFFAVLIGAIVGLCSILFVKSLLFVTEFRTSHPNIIYFLPVGGLAIVGLYHLFNNKTDPGTNLVISTVQAKAEIPFRMAPMIYISTVITHALGGSAGREGAALQLGGSLGNALARALKLEEHDARVLVMCGMSAAFSAMFGTPMAASIFPLEVVSVGIMHYSALVPCVFSSLIASIFAMQMEIAPETFIVTSIPEFDAGTLVQFTFLGILCALVSIAFCVMLHGTGYLLHKHIKNQYFRILSASVAIILLTLLLGTQEYSGTGIPLIEQAFEGHVKPYTFLLKMIFTTLTLEAGFKGGEIVPAFTIGATFGCLFATLFGISPSLGTAVGMASVFCGVTNCPITSMIIGFELFGFSSMKFMLVSVSISYMLSGYFGLYKDQKIIYSKYSTTYINRKTNHLE